MAEKLLARKHHAFSWVAACFSDEELTAFRNFSDRLAEQIAGLDEQGLQRQ